MKRRVLVRIGAAFAMTVVLGLLLRPQTSLSGQASNRASEGLTTPWGEPNLEGIWSSNYQVPLQRPERYKDQEFFTEAEIAELDRLRLTADRLGGFHVKRGTVQDVNNAYNSVFTSQKRTGRRTSLIVDPPDGRMPAEAPEAAKRRAEIIAFENMTMRATEACKNNMPGCAGGTYGPPPPQYHDTPPHYLATPSRAGGGGAINRANGPEDRNLEERCLGPGAQSGLPNFGGFWRIVQSPGFVSIYYDVGQGQGWQRIIPITDAPHLPTDVRQWRGDWRGRWEGHTLVVDVTNFNAKRDYSGSREHTHLVERFRRVDEENLEYSVTVEDPTAWVRPWTVKQDLNRQDNRANRIYYEPRCHEGNYGMAALLIGARAEEKAYAEGRGPHPATICGGGCGLGIDPENADPLSR